MKTLALITSMTLLAVLMTFSDLSAQSKSTKTLQKNCNSSIKFDFPKPNSWVRDSLFFVGIKPVNARDIASIDLYINNKLVSRDVKAPFRWGSGSGLKGGPKRYQPGTYKLKAVVTDKCGRKNTQYNTFRVKKVNKVKK